MHQLPNVAGPILLLQQLNCRGREPTDCDPVTLGEALERLSGERRNVFESVSQWGTLDRHCTDTIVQIEAKPALINEMLKIPVTGADETEI
jgi:hypothetical protein